MPFIDPSEAFRCPDLHFEVRLSHEVLSHFEKHKQDAFWKSEAGGQLFANINEGLWEIVKATGPRRSDYRSRFRFFPQRKDEQSEINVLFDSGLHYVGDWHTHPESTPTPSSLDLKSMEELVRRSKHELPGFLMIIVGTEDAPRGLWVSLHQPDAITNRLKTPDARTSGSS